MVVLIETWLDRQLPSTILFDGAQWEVYRRDRCDSGDGREGGGVLIAVKECLCPTGVQITNDETVERT